MINILDIHDELFSEYAKHINFGRISCSYVEFCDAIRFSPTPRRAVFEFWKTFPLTTAMFAKAKELMKCKNHDYADTSDPFLNFRMCEQAQLCSTLIGMLVRLGDKVSRFENLSIKKKEQKVKDESIEDTLLDIINYCVLIISYIESNIVNN